MMMMMMVGVVDWEISVECVIELNNLLMGVFVYFLHLRSAV